MKHLSLLLLVCVSFIKTQAQLSLQYTNTRQAPASHNMTILDQVCDSNGNIYIIYSDDPSKIHLISKINAGGTTLWTDTLQVNGFPQVNVTAAKINLGQNKILILFPAYGVPSPAAAVIAMYDLNGNYLNGFKASDLNNVWTYGVYGIHEKSSGNILVYYAYGDQFTNDDTMFVREFLPNFSPLWTLKYPVSKLTWHCPNTLDASGNFYFTYTNDSVSAGIHYLQCYTRKADNSGNILWTNMIQNVAGNQIKKMLNGDLAISGNNNPGGSILGNNAGDIKIARISDNTGDTVWTGSYAGNAGERDEVVSMTVDQLNNIYIGGTEDIHDYSPMINKSFLQKYNSSGVLQYNKKITAESAHAGLYLDALANLNSLSVLSSGAVHLKKISASTGNTIDSITSAITYPMGKTGACNNSDDDVFFTYSEGHCGANHMEVKRFCTRAICNPNSTFIVDLNETIQIFPNPSSDKISIQVSSNDKITEAHIYSITGELLKNVFQDDHFEISNLSPGLYFTQVVCGSRTYTGRFVKE